MSTGVFIFILIISLVIIGISGYASYVFYKDNDEYKTIKVINSFSKVYDPFTDDPSITITCDDNQTLNIIHADNEVYNPNLECSSSATDSLISTCKSNPTAPECKNTDPKNNYVNTVCGPSGSGDCQNVDLTSYIGNKCNGKKSCVIDSSILKLAPKVCQKLTSTNYPNLPQDSSNKQGYQLHGIYGCDLKVTKLL
jgi:hypothetical protein